MPALSDAVANSNINGVAGDPRLQAAIDGSIIGPNSLGPKPVTNKVDDLLKAAADEVAGLASAENAAPLNLDESDLNTSPPSLVADDQWRLVVPEKSNDGAADVIGGEGNDTFRLRTPADGQRSFQLSDEIVNSNIEGVAVDPRLQAGIEELQDSLADGSLFGDNPFKPEIPKLPEELPPSFPGIDVPGPQPGPFPPVDLTGESVNKLVGTLDNDILNAGSMSELITGNKGLDTFRFDSLGDSRLGAIDRIMDFGLGDKIDLSGIDASVLAKGDQAFSYVEYGDKIGAGQMSSHFDVKSGMTVIEAHTNNDGAADFMLELAGNIPLSQQSFNL